MNGHRVDLERLVQAPAERVWEVLTDVARADQTLSGVDHVELITDGPYRVGTRWRETRRMFGKESTEQMQVTVAETPTRTVIETDSSGVHYVTEFTLTPSSAGATRLAMSFTAAQGQANLLHKTLWLLFGRLGAKATEKLMAQDLQDIAARAESCGSANHGLEGMERRLAEGESLADTLVGLPVEEAARRARDRGFVPEELPEDVGAVTTDLHSDRMRLFVDPTGQVVRARAG